MIDNKEIVSFFSGKVANEYDIRANRIAPIQQALYFAIYLALKDLKPDAEILSVGTGTGNEIIFLSQKFPNWHFTCIEPAQEMADIFTYKVKAANIENRITIFTGFLSDYISDKKYDAALSLLVSHFFVDEQKRTQFFAEIAQRLENNGILINADISADMNSNEFQSLLKVWLNMQKESGLDDNLVMEHIISGMGKTYAVCSNDTIVKILENAGFESPALFYRNILINAWLSQIH